VELDPLAERDLSEQLLVFYTGVTRKAETILAEQQNNISQRLVVLRRIKEIAETAHREVCNGNIDAVGYLLDESWHLKKQLASQVSNNTINAMYEAARQAGALGGKITGAGGGGFLMLYVPLERRQAVRSALGNLRELPIRIEPDGAKVIFNYRR
jgi:D-glycero-alpha-D-manno-heptose-7-phosphate kinase